MRYLLLAIFCSFGVVMLYVGLTQFMLQRTLVANPLRIDVLITRSDVTAHASDDSDSRSTTTYRPNIAFRYELDGRTYTSELLKPTIIAQTYASREAAADQIRAFPKDATVQAFYRPEFPSKAYLVCEAGAGPIVFVIIGIMTPPLSFLIVKYAM